MHVGGIGAGSVGPEIGAGAAGGAINGTHTSAGGQNPGSAGDVLSASIPGSLQELAGILESHSTAEILLALMLASAAERKGDDDSSSAGLGFLAGLALAGQVGQALTGDLQLSVQLQPPEGAGGGTINFLA